MLNLASISSDDIVFLDDIVKLPKRIFSNPIYLVDHNSLDRKDLENFNGSIAGIIDHHKDEGGSLHADPRIIEECGSCCTLVCRYFMPVIRSLYDSKVSELHQTATNLAVLALGPILIDTGNLKNEKTTDTDVKIVNDLCSFVPKDWVRDEFFDTLKEKKKSCKGFSFDDLLRRDLKQYFPDGIVVNYASVGKGLDWIKKKRLGWEDELKSFAEVQNSDLVIVGLSLSKNDEFGRQLILYKRTERGAGLADSFLKLSKQNLGLEIIEEKDNGDLSMWNQRNSAASRKKVVPLLMDSVKQVASK